MKNNCVEEVFFFCFKMNTLLFCVFTFRVDCEMYSFSKMRSTFVREKTNNLWLFQDKHYELSVTFDKMSNVWL